MNTRDSFVGAHGGVPWACGRMPPHAKGTRPLASTPIAILLLITVVAGCQEPNYRTEVVGNGEGGVEVHKVPKTQEELAQDQARTNPAAAASAADQSRLDAMEQRIRQQDQEIARLKKQLNATQPATAP